MKKLLFIFLLFVFQLSICEAQDTLSFNNTQKGRLVINMGVGYSPGFDGEVSFITPVFPVPKLYEYFEGYSITPNIGIVLDYGLTKKVSIGFAGSYQSERMVNDDEFSTDKLTRINMAFRLLDHLNKKNKYFDHYIGLRIGCSYWRDVPSLNNAYENSSGFIPMYFILSPSLFVPSFQILYGVRIYFTDDFGIHFEAGMGSPYLLEGGLTFRIKTKK